MTNEPAARIHPPIERVMDHHLLFLKSDASSPDPSFLLSLFTFRYIRHVGSGHVAFIGASIDGEERALTLTDDERVGTEVLPLFAPRRTRDAYVAVGLAPGTFGAPPLGGPQTWRIDGAGLSIEASWEDLAPPFLASGPSPNRPDTFDVHSVLFEAGSARASINGVPVVGSPYPNDTWTPWLGRPLSSCLFAIGEVLVESTSA